MNNILLIASIFGFVLTSLIFSKKSTNKQATYFLGIFYLLMSIYSLQTYIIDSGQLEKYSFFFLWPLVTYNLFCVPIYFYFQSIMDDQLVLKPVNAFLFIPFVLGVIDVSYIYLQSDAIYNGIFQSAVNNPTARLHVHYWLLTLKEHFLIRHIWQFSVLLLLFPKLVHFIKQGNGERLKAILNRWLLFFWAILVIMSFFAIVYALEKYTELEHINLNKIEDSTTQIIPLILYLVVFITGILPIYFGSIFQGYPKPVQISTIFASDLETTSDVRYGLDMDIIEKKLAVLKQKKKYLEQDFNVTSCARDLDVPAHHLSYFLNQQYNLSFATFKNTLRIQEAQKLISSGFLESSTIEALAWKCGFADRSSFGKVFRNITELSPSEYLLKIQNFH